MTVKEMPQKAPKEKKDNRREFVLSTGEKVVIREGKGRDAERAMQFAGSGQREKYMSALMSYTVTIDGKPVVPEVLSDLPLRDYTKIQSEFADINF